MGDYVVSLEDFEQGVLANIETNTTNILDAINEQRDLATRVAADIFVRAADRFGSDSEMCEIAARDAIRAGRIFAEAVAKEGK